MTIEPETQTSKEDLSEPHHRSAMKKASFPESFFRAARDLGRGLFDCKANKPVDLSIWSESKKRSSPETWPEFTPTFKINRNDKIFTIGSCFARNIEEHLAKCGCQVPTMQFAVPKTECRGRSNGLLNKYTPPSIFQELSWCERVHLKGGSVTLEDIERMLYSCGDGTVIDMHLGGFVPVTKERAIARRQEVFDVFLHAFSSQVVVMTFGLNEAWYDLIQNLFILRFPSVKMKSDMLRFKFMRLTYADCYGYAQKTLALIQKYNPRCHFLITTSPVPLLRTFAGEDVIVANTYSKSVLRALCGELAEKNDGVDYFPAYESVVLTRERPVYAADRRHVSDKFVEKIVRRVVDLYF